MTDSNVSRLLGGIVEGNTVNAISSAFDFMGVAEDVISKSGSIANDNFKMFCPVEFFSNTTIKLYELHANELGSRMVGGCKSRKELCNPTDAEVLWFYHNASLNAPLTSEATWYYTYLFKKNFKGELEDIELPPFPNGESGRKHFIEDVRRDVSKFTSERGNL